MRASAFGVSGEKQTARAAGSQSELGVSAENYPILPSCSSAPASGRGRRWRRRSPGCPPACSGRKGSAWRPRSGGFGCWPSVRLSSSTMSARPARSGPQGIQPRGDPGFVSNCGSIRVEADARSALPPHEWWRFVTRRNRPGPTDPRTTHSPILPDSGDGLRMG